MSWISLHNHSQYSILDSTLSVEDIAKLAKSYNMPAVALTDSGNMYGVVEFYKACQNEGIKPIIGCEFWVASQSRLIKKRSPGKPHAYSIVLLAKNEEGYRNLCKLSSIGYLEGFYYYPRIDKEVLKKYKNGLICLSGSTKGSVGYHILNSTDERIEKEIKWYQDLFQEDYYFEIQSHRMKEEDIISDQMKKESWLLQNLNSFIEKQEKVNERIFQLSEKFNIKYIATNDVHYPKREDWQGHEILLNIQSGEACEIWERDSLGNPKNRVPNPKRKVYSSHEFYFKSPEEMHDIFAKYPDSLSNTLEIAEKCNFILDFKTKHYPVFFPPTYTEGSDRAKLAEEYLYKLCLDAIEIRYAKEKLDKIKKKYPDKDPLKTVKDRLEYEFQLISSKGMCDYLLIVHDFISWAKKQGITVGPGRGSAAGSIICYLIGITDIEPLRFNLFFERFINPERIAYPDIDVDICMERRSEVIDYTVKKYGKERVAQIITFGTMKAKMAIKDVGRVLSVPLVKVNAIAKLVPEDPNMTLEKALNIDPELKRTYLNDSEAKRIIDIAKKIEGSIRNTSTHAAGMIISANPLTDHIPVCIAKDSEMIVTQYAMKPVEAIGLLKIDFLGLKTLTSIQKALKSIETNTNKKIDWISLDLEDKKTFNLLNQGKTLGVFQLESGGMQELAKQLHIDVFEEIIAVGALYRPGPMDMIPSFIRRKHRQEAIEIEHPLMKDILEETYGVMVYQEQVMQIASKLAGYSLGEGDVLRRAMGKKDQTEMNRQRKKFINGAKANNISDDIAKSVFDKIEKFAMYGFNKSHAAAYAFISYTTAFLKANYPNEWMAALMTCDRYDLSKVAKFIGECKSMQISILPPDVNEAGDEFVATKEGVRFAMSGIKGVGSGVVESIVYEREKNGHYKDLFDFFKRIDTTKVGKKNIELLIDAGAFDFMKWSRDAMKQIVERNYEEASIAQKDKAKGVMNLFSLIEEEKEQIIEPEVLNKSTTLQILQKEKELLGFYLTGHPMDKYQNIMQRLSCVPLTEFENLKEGSLCRAAFVVEDVKVKISIKSQRKFAIIVISDGMGNFELPIWPDLYEKKSELLVENQLLYAILQIEKNGLDVKLNCRWLDNLTEANDEMIKQCDEIYDKLKDQSKNFDFKKKNGSFSSKKEKKEEYSLLKIKVDAEKTNLSNILNLKQFFRENLGTTKIILEFLSKGKNVGFIEVDSTWGIKYNENMKNYLNKILSIIDIHAS